MCVCVCICVCECEYEFGYRWASEFRCRCRCKCGCRCLQVCMCARACMCAHACMCVYMYMQCVRVFKIFAQTRAAGAITRKRYSNTPRQRNPCAKRHQFNGWGRCFKGCQQNADKRTKIHAHTDDPTHPRNSQGASNTTGHAKNNQREQLQIRKSAHSCQPAKSFE